MGGARLLGCKRPLTAVVGVAAVQLASINVPNEEPNRYALRNLLFGSPGIEEFISGVVSAAPASWTARGPGCPGPLAVHAP